MGQWRQCCWHARARRRPGTARKRLTAVGDDREQIVAAGQTADDFFADLWGDGDPWRLDDSGLDQQRYRRQAELLADRRYTRALEIGCAAGSFTRFLAPLCDHLLALDISSEAVARARARDLGDHIDFRVANVMDFDPAAEGPWDLVVLTETAYYLGWLYPMFDVAWLAHALFDATSPGGRLLLVNSYGRESGLMSPWLIDTYRDLFRNVGYHVDNEEVMTGVKDETTFDILLTLLSRLKT